MNKRAVSAALLAALLAAFFIPQATGCDAAVETRVAMAPGPTLAPAPSATPSKTPSPRPIPTTEPDPTPTATPPHVDVDLPYYIKVDKAAQITTVYTLDEEGKYTIAVRQMLCSTGTSRKRTPEGLYRLKAERHLWHKMVDGTLGRYAVRITGSFLFHSVPYRRKNSPGSMHGEMFNELGTMASRGCVRLALCDVKWIYDNCPAGTPVEIVWGEEAPELWAQLKHAAVSFEQGWDPTDSEAPGYAAPPPAPEPTRCPWATPAPLENSFSKDMAKFTHGTPAPADPPPDTPPVDAPPDTPPAGP